MTAEHGAFARPTFTAADFERDEPLTNPGEASAFAPTPIYARTPKKKGLFGGSKPAAERVETVTTERVITQSDPYAVPTERVVATERVTPAAATATAAPIYARKPAPKGGALSPAVIVGGVALVAALGAGAYFMSQPQETGIAQVTPGEPAATAPAFSTEPTTLAQAPMTSPAAERMAPEATVTERVSAPARTQARDPAPVRVARARPATAPAAAASATSVEGWATDTSATIPAAPVPYSATAQAPGAVNPAPVVVPPVTPSAAAPMPSTPPVAAEPTPEPAPEAAAVPPTL